MTVTGNDGGGLRAFVEATERTVEPGAKGWPPEAWGRSAADLAGLGLHVDDLPTPVVTLDREALRHNVALMARYCAERGVSLAPHAKTTMAPLVVRQQMAAGAWAATAATWTQARLLHAFGCRRLLVANQMLDPHGLRWAAAAQRDGTADVLCFVDSVAAVGAMDGVLAGDVAGAAIGVLVEVGVGGGRTGSRTPDEAVAVAQAVARCPRLRLRGVAAFEGIALHERSGAELARVRALIDDARALTERLGDAGLFGGGDEVIVTAGGSALFDEVVAGLAGSWDRPAAVRVVLRSGCYVTHDSGFYDALSPLSSRAGDPGRLRPALRLRGRVLSRPEPSRAVADFGRRDASYDLGLPVVHSVVRGDATLGGAAPVVAELYDQHALLDVGPADDLAVGDLLDCGVSHPCTTIDRWRALPVVDPDGLVVDVARTYF